MNNLLALPKGTKLAGEYRIEGILGSGGFGITYLADELPLERRVAIKEYFPVDFAARDGTTLVREKSKSAEGDYDWGLERFIEEAQALARFDHNNIIRVFRYFRENNTAYMVLHFEQGQSLKAWLDLLKRPPTQAELDAIIAPLLDALSLIHAADMLHRDIAPDNILIRKNGSPVLIDFGSAREEIVQHSKTVSAIVKPGYSPVEQYAITSRQQGPWTDIYALGATLYHAVTGRRPIDAPSRVTSDELVPAACAVRATYRRSFLAGIDRALLLEPAKRPRSVAEWRPLLLGTTDAAGWPAATRKPERRTGRRKHRLISLLRSAAIRPTKKAPAMPEPPPSAPPTRTQTQTQTPDLPARARPEAQPKPQPRPAGRRRPVLRSAQILVVIGALAALTYGQGWIGQDILARARPESRPISWQERISEFSQSARDWIAERLTPPLRSKKERALARRSRSDVLAILRGHTDAVQGIAFTPSGRGLVSGGLDRTIRLWNIETGESTGTLARTDSAINALATFGRRLVSGHSDGLLVLRDRKTGAVLGTFRHHEGLVWAIAFAGNENRFVTAGQDGTVKLWDSRIARAPIEILGNNTGAIQALAYSPTEQLIATGGADRRVRLWDIARRRVRKLRGHRDAITALAFSPDGRLLASVGLDGRLKLWSSRSRRVRRTLRGPRGALYTVAFSPDGRLIAAAGADRTIELWDVRRRRLVHVLEGHSDAVRALVFSPDGRILASASDDRTIRLWHIPLPARAKR